MLTILYSSDAAIAGFEAAKEYIKHGADVTIVARNPDRLKTALNELQKYRINSKQNIRSIAVDVASSQQLVSAAFESLGRVDVLLNSAG